MSHLKGTQVAEIVIEMSKRLVEQGQDVIILLDSITRLAELTILHHHIVVKFYLGELIQMLFINQRFWSARNIEGGEA